MAKRAARDDISWEQAITLVLRENGGAMRYTDIAAEISTRGLKSVANPAASVAATFSKSIIQKLDQLAIHERSMFPELDRSAAHIKSSLRAGRVKRSII